MTIAWLLLTATVFDALTTIFSISFLGLNELNPAYHASPTSFWAIKAVATIFIVLWRHSALRDGRRELVVTSHIIVSVACIGIVSAALWNAIQFAMITWQVPFPPLPRLFQLWSNL